MRTTSQIASASTGRAAAAAREPPAARAPSPAGRSAPRSVAVEHGESYMQSTRPRQLSAAAMHHYAFRNADPRGAPQLRRLYGAEPRQLHNGDGSDAARWGLARALADAPLLLIGALACTVGCWLVHGLGTYAHEQARASSRASRRRRPSTC